MAAKSKNRLLPSSRKGALASAGHAKASRSHARSSTKGRTYFKSVPATSNARRSVPQYRPFKGVDELIEKIRHATPLELVEVERGGVGGRLLKEMAKEMDIPTSRLFNMIGVPKATAEKKAATNEAITGAGGQAAIGMVRLLGIAQAIAENSTADVKDFDVRKWLGQWLERPQPALGGKKPADLLDTPTGLEVVSRLLGAVESGAYL
jgi:putative toxin-antitoxin system antitoxin component (TIGR02293 family)